jgi:hypothetical protein
MPDPIQDALAEARSKLDKLVAERARIDKQIIEWKRVVDSLTVVSEEASDELPADVTLDERLALTMKFTDGVRMALQLAGGPLTVPQLRDQLVSVGFDFSKYKQELVPLHNTLKRLEEQGEVKIIRDTQERVIGYQWISPIERALATEGAMRSPNCFADIVKSLGEIGVGPTHPARKVANSARFAHASRQRTMPPSPESEKK